MNWYPRVLCWLNFRQNHVGETTVAVPSPYDGDKTVPYWYDAIANMANNLAQVGFTDVGLVAGSIGVAAGSTDDMSGIANEGETRLGEWNCRCDGRIEVDVIAGFGDPVMLDVE